MSGPKRWPSFPILVVGVLVTLLSAAQLGDLQINGDLYGLLGDDDPAVMTFREVAAVTTGLEELLVICETDQYMPRLAIDKIVALPEIDANTRTYIQPGKSSLYAFALTGDPADYRDAGIAVDRVDAVLTTMAPSCGMAGTPAFIVETHERLDVDLLKALGIALILVTLLFAFVYRIGWLAMLMMLPVGVGIGWGLAVYSLLRPELTLLAAAVPTLLIGIGIDHCIHMIQASRYAMKKDGLSRDAAVLAAWRRVIVPISVASLTTIATFCALALAELRGFADLGLSGALVSAGVYLSCISLLPVILLSCPEHWLSGKAAISMPLRRLASLIQKRGKLIAIGTVVVTIIAAFSGALSSVISIASASMPVGAPITRITLIPLPVTILLSASTIISVAPMPRRSKVDETSGTLSLDRIRVRVPWRFRTIFSASVFPSNWRCNSGETLPSGAARTLSEAIWERTTRSVR